MSATSWPHRIRFRCDLSANDLSGQGSGTTSRPPEPAFGVVVIWQIPFAPLNGYSMLKPKARING